MQNLLLYLYRKHIHSSDPHAQALCKQQSLRIYTLNQQQLQFYNTMIVRNFFTYSPASMELKLSVKHLLGMYRLTKFENVIQENGLDAVWGEWIKNEMMPITYNGKKLEQSKFVYIDFKQQHKKQDKKHEMQQQQMKQVKRKNSKSKQVQKQLTSKKQPQPAQKHEIASKTILNINLIQLTIQLQNRLICSNLNLQPIDIKYQQKRLQALLTLQYQKIQQYMNQRFNQQVLMVFNFINKYPYIDQKTLLNKTMISAIQLRRSLAKLISEGWVICYPENSKNLLYKSLQKQRIRERCCDSIAQALLNMYIYLQTSSIRKQQMQDEQKIHVLLKSIQQLDDILMIFTA